MTSSANCNFGSGDFCASFDFHPSILPKIVSGLPNELANPFTDALNRSPFQAAAGLAIEIDVVVNIGDITQGQYEEFAPLIIREVLASRFNTSEVPNDPKDIPPYVFKLREHFALK